MKHWLFDIPRKLNNVSNTLDVESLLCQKAWLIYTDDNVRQVLIFRPGGGLIISTNGEVVHSTWEYISVNHCLIINVVDKSWMYHPFFNDDTLFVLSLDGQQDNYLVLTDDSTPLPTLPSIQQKLVSGPSANRPSITPAKPEPRPLPRISTRSLSPINGHNPVDLGLSVKWSATNIGANLPEECGDAYQWGGSSGDPGKTFDYWDEGLFRMKTYRSDAKTRLDAKHDTATIFWKSPWRMPTQYEYYELFSNCDVEAIHKNGVAVALKFTSKINAQSIMLPEGNYWTSELHLDTDDDRETNRIFGLCNNQDAILARAYYFECSGETRLYFDHDNRSFYHFVRPVCE